MDEKFIRQIPKYIEKKIRATDKKSCPAQKGLHFYAYLTTIKKELVKITVAVRNRNKKERLIKQVAVHGVLSAQCLVRDMEYAFMGGYRVGWFDEGFKYAYGRPYYNDGKWYPADFKYYNPWAKVVNPEFALTLREFRYSAADIQKPSCIISYLRTYIRYPQLEYLVKAGLGKFANSKLILEKTGKDKRFYKWLIANKKALLNRRYYHKSAACKTEKISLKSLMILVSYAIFFFLLFFICFRHV